MSGKIEVMLFIFIGIGAFKICIAQIAIPFEIERNSACNYSSTVHLLPNTKYKKLPRGYQQEVLVALRHFPELQHVPVTFRIKKSFATLKTRPTFLSMFMPRGCRSYVVTISDKTIQKLIPIIFENLPEAARVGVTGHELSHVVDFSKKNIWQSFKVAIGHLNKHYMDSLEFNTDKICLEHGLGKELETWSSYIRKSMHTTYWRGADFVTKGDTHYERYMNPVTIEKYIEEVNHVTASTITNAH